MLGVNCDNRYLYSIRSNRLSLGAEHWVGKELSAISRQLSVKPKPAQAGDWI
jgi:hypothetical protein